MEKDTPLVSICMPAYNAGKYITEAVKSVLNQSYLNLELIIVNDGSTDNTAQKLKKINDVRVSVYEQANQGQSAAANAAYSKASGELIKFMDADDMISPNFIKNQVDRLGTRRDAIISATWGRFYNDDLSTFKLISEDVWRDMPPQKWLITSWQNANAMMQCALWLIPRRILDSSGLWNENLSLINDFDFFTRVLLNSTQVLFEKEAILYYRSGLIGSLSDTKHRKAILSAFQSIDNATENLLSVNPGRPAAQACANIWQSFIYHHYPQQTDLMYAAQEKINKLGGSTLKFSAGGLTKILVTLIGWKAAKQLKTIINNK